MNRLTALTLLFLLFLSFSGCKKAGEEKPSGSLLDLNRSPEVLIFDKDKNEPQPIPPSASEPRMSVVLHPDMKGPSKAEEAMALSETNKDDGEIILRPLAKYMDSRNYILYLAVINNSNRGRNVIIYLYGYDKKGRLVSSSKQLPYLAAKEQYLRRWTFPRTGREVRWVFKASFRR